MRTLRSIAQWSSMLCPNRDRSEKVSLGVFDVWVTRRICSRQEWGKEEEHVYHPEEWMGNHGKLPLLKRSMKRRYGLFLYNEVQRTGTDGSTNRSDIRYNTCLVSSNI